MESIRRKVETCIAKCLFDISQKIRGQYRFEFLKLITLRRNGKLGNMRGDDYAQTIVTYFKDIDKRVS